MTNVALRHIVIDSKGVARIEGTRTRVIDVALDTQTYGLSPEEIHQAHRHLSLGQIHAALAYYYDHRAQIDAAIQAEVRHPQALRHGSEATRPPLTKAALLKRLHAMGKPS